MFLGVTGVTANMLICEFTLVTVCAHVVAANPKPFSEAHASCCSCALADIYGIGWRSIQMTQPNVHHTYPAYLLSATGEPPPH